MLSDGKTVKWVFGSMETGLPIKTITESLETVLTATNNCFLTINGKSYPFLTVDSQMLGR